MIELRYKMDIWWSKQVNIFFLRLMIGKRTDLFDTFKTAASFNLEESEAIGTPRYKLSKE